MSEPALTSSQPNNVSSIVPGSIFQDDIPPPTLTDGSGDVSAPSSQYTPPDMGAGDDGGTTQIKVSNTTQIVLISLGAAIAVLVLFGIAASFYISHKNKKAERLKQEGKHPDGSADNGHPEDDTIGHEGIESGEKGQVHTVDTDTDSGSEIESTGTGIGTEYRDAGPSSPSIGLSMTTRVGANPFITPRSSQSEASGLAAAGVTESLVAAAARSAGRPNPWNSIIGVAQTYSGSQGMIHPLETVGPLQRTSMVMNFSNIGPRAYDEVMTSAPITVSSSNYNRSNPFQTKNNSTTILDITADPSFNDLQQLESDSQEAQEQEAIIDSLAISQATAVLDSTLASGSLFTVPGEWYIPRRSQDDNKTYCYTSSHTPVSPSIVLDGADSTSSISGDISYQPPPRPTSPISRRGRLPNKVWGPTAQPSSHAFRNGAAVFEGVSIPRPQQARSPSPERQRRRPQRRSIDDSETVIVSLPSPRGCLLEAKEEEEEEEEENEGGRGRLQISLGQDDSLGDLPYLEYGIHPQHRGRPQFQTLTHSSDENSSPHANPKIVRRVSKQQNERAKGTVKNTYLDDYRESRQQLSQ
ncbi:hypothetical protein BGZ54_002603 [Gamsiella multidivaricata]|nr:hypothetical protein BGZ54_002603 [Gamsiella multidivaricata]